MIFSLGNIFLLNNDYFELWVVCIYLVFYLVLKGKDIFYESKQIIKINTTDEYFIFNKDFQNDFTFDEFSNILLKNCSLKRSHYRSKLFSSEGGPFDRIYYFVIIPKSAFVTLRHQKMIISYIKESSWIGVVEFISELFDDSMRQWNIGLSIDNPSGEEVVWLEWDKNV